LRGDAISEQRRAALVRRFRPDFGACRKVAVMPQTAGLIVKAKQIHPMDGADRVYRSIAIRDEWIVAVSADPDGLDGLRDDQTRMISKPELTVLPAFFDTHEHLLESARNLALVQADEARSIGELIGLIQSRALQTPPGRWIVTSTGWNEERLAERRLPIASELDQATNAHPVLCPRGGHICAANSLALRLGPPAAPAREAPRESTDAGRSVCVAGTGKLSDLLIDARRRYEVFDRLRGAALEDPGQHAVAIAADRATRRIRCVTRHPTSIEAGRSGSMPPATSRSRQPSMRTSKS
jgi:predicted amidohydrolase YtcJ